MTMLERPIHRTKTPSQRELDNVEDAVWRPIPQYILLWRKLVQSLTKWWG